jgi:hypothetical protein
VSDTGSPEPLLVIVTFQINGQSCEGLTHSEVLSCLKNAGSIVVLTVKYFKPAAPFLNKQTSLGRLL